MVVVGCMVEGRRHAFDFELGVAPRVVDVFAHVEEGHDVVKPPLSGGDVNGVDLAAVLQHFTLAGIYYDKAVGHFFWLVDDIFTEITTLAGL